ncbi:uncharacterized protein [Halyomorpha halys]|uniref:uncharacterized protein n=1 Tax=Halyomorpha halys TaxID=286706 RepID=UPI0034D1C3C9
MLRPPLKLKIYKSIIRPTLLYDAPLMRHLYNTTLAKLQSFQNSLLRQIVIGTTLQRARNRVIREDLQIPSVPEFIGHTHIKFFDGLKACANPLFREISPPPKPGRWQSTVPLVDVLAEGRTSGSAA